MRAQLKFSSTFRQACHFHFDKNTLLVHKFGFSFLFIMCICQCKKICEYSFEMCHMHNEKYKYRTQKKFYTRSYYVVSYLKVSELCIFSVFIFPSLCCSCLQSGEEQQIRHFSKVIDIFHHHFEKYAQINHVLYLMNFE